MRGSVAERFARKFEPCLMSGCWLWSDAPNTAGYGRLLVAGRAVSAHRVSYELHKGQIPDGLYVCHRCDTPLCVNPDHLFLGTYEDNMADMDAKGRRRANVPPRNRAKGTRQPHAVLTEEIVADLRSRRARGEKINQGQMARALGVAQSVLSRAVNGVTWKHVRT